MAETQQSIVEWQHQTFGPPLSTRQIAARALDELLELVESVALDEMSPEAPAEAADVVIVLMGLFARLGTTWWAEVDRKMGINRTRTWVRCGNGHGHHVEAP